MVEHRSETYSGGKPVGKPYGGAKCDGKPQILALAPYIDAGGEGGREEDPPSEGKIECHTSTEIARRRACDHCADQVA